MDKIPDVGEIERDRVMAAANAALAHKITLDQWEAVIDGKMTLASALRLNRPAPLTF